MYTNNYMSNCTHLCNRIHLVNFGLCCLFDIYLCSNSLSSLAKFSLLTKFDFLPACFSCSDNLFYDKTHRNHMIKTFLKFQKP